MLGSSNLLKSGADLGEPVKSRIPRKNATVCSFQFCVESPFGVITHSCSF